MARTFSSTRCEKMGKRQEVLINGAFASVELIGIGKEKGRQKREGKKSGVAGIRGLAVEGIGREGERRNGGRKRKTRG